MKQKKYTIKIKEEVARDAKENSVNETVEKFRIHKKAFKSGRKKKIA